MTYPPGVVLRPVTVGGATTTESGDPLTLRAHITASRKLMIRDGWQYGSDTRINTRAPRTELAFDLPPSDQPGWRTENNQIIDVSAPNSYTHTYTIKVTRFRLGDHGREIPVGQPTLYTNVYIPTDDLTPLDLDNLVPVTTVAGGVVQVPDVWSAQVADAVAAAGSADAAAASATAAGQSADVAQTAQGLAELAEARAVDTLAMLDAWSSNLFVIDDATPDQVLPAGSATPIANADYAVSAPIMVTPGEQLTFTGVLRVTRLNNGVYVSHSDHNHLTATITIAAGVTHIRLSVQEVRLPTAQLNRGSVLLPYELGGTVSIPQRNLEVAPTEQTGNLLNLDTITPWYIIGTDGIASVNSAWNLSDWIPVTAGPYTGWATNNWYHVAWYDKDRNFLSRSTGTAAAPTVTAPTAAAWARVAAHTFDLDVDLPRFTRGSTATTERFGVRVGGASIPPVAPSANVALARRYMVNRSALEAGYDGPVIAAQPGLDATYAADVHGWYDALVTAHPDYVSRVELGQASGAAGPIYQYTLKPPRVPVTARPETMPAILIISGVHGYEKAAVWHTWRFAKALCDEWATSAALEELRWGFEVVIVPVGNPYGYNVSQPGVIQRPNANGVDIARNFSHLWTLSAVGDTYSGAAPMSEPETIALDAAMQAVKDRAILGVTMHNFSTPTTATWQFLWTAAATRLMVLIGKRLSSQMSRKWKANHAWITDTATYFGYSDDRAGGAPGGGEAMQMKGYGINAATFETSRLQRLDGGLAEVHSERAMTLGYEATVNWIIQGALAGLDIYSPRSGD